VIQKVFRTYLYVALNELPMDRMIDEFIYFVRTSEDMIPLPNSLDEAVAALPNHVEIGYVNGRSLLALERLITQVRLMFAVGITFALFLNICLIGINRLHIFSEYLDQVTSIWYIVIHHYSRSLFTLRVLRTHGLCTLSPELPQSRS